MTEPLEHGADATPLPASILLLGARASGKSTVGAQLARILDRTFVDLDDQTFGEFEATTVREIWERSGSAAWRRAEVRVLDRVLGDPTAKVVALGGGTPLIDAARDMIALSRRRGTSIAVYLRNDPATLRARLTAEPGDRPSLTGRPIEEEIADVLAEREPTYRRLADVVIDADAGTAEEVARTLRARLLEGRGV